MRPRILIVDDDPLFREFLRDVLPTADYDLVEAADGVEALDEVNQVVPDVILLDLVLPVLDGYEVFHALKDHPVASATPIIFVTARTEPELSRLAAQAGAFAYLPKPVRAETLVATITLALRARRRPPEESS